MRLPKHVFNRSRVVAVILGATLTLINLAAALAGGGGIGTYPK